MVYLVSKTNFHHNQCEVVGIFTNKNKFIKACKEIISNDLKTDSGQMDFEEEKDNIKYHQDNFFEQRQTQGLRNFELIYEEYETNVIDASLI